MASLPNIRPKSERNRFSLILQLGSSRRPNDARTTSPLSSPMSSVSPHIVSPSTVRGSFANLSHNRSCTTSSQNDFPGLVARDNVQSVVSVSSTLNDLHTNENAQLLKKARKLSRVFGEAVVLSQPVLPVEDIRTPTFLDAERWPNGPNSPALRSSGDGTSKRRSILRLSYQPDIVNHSQSSKAIPLEIHYPPSSPADIADDAKTRDVDPSYDPSPGYKPARDEALLDLYGDTNSCRSRSLSIQRSSLDLDLLSSTAFDSGGYAPAAEDCGGQIPSLSLHSHWTRYPDIVAVMAERDRLLNVKRARKMTQVRSLLLTPSLTFVSLLTSSCQLFGHDPPLELFHITHDMSRHSLSSISTESASSYAISATKVPIPELGTSASLLMGVDSPREEVMPMSRNEQSQSFHERRRRAAKLAQFFGVGCHDISPSLVVPHRPVLCERSTPLCSKEDPAFQVDIKISGRSRLWGRPNLKDVSIVDARNKLRALKTA